MKAIQVPMEEELLKEVSEKARSGFKNRSAFIREACRQFIKKLEEKEKEEAYVRGYRKMPEKVDMAGVSAKLVTKVMEKENW